MRHLESKMLVGLALLAVGCDSASRATQCEIDPASCCDLDPTLPGCTGEVDSTAEVESDTTASDSADDGAIDTSEFDGSLGDTAGADGEPDTSLDSAFGDDADDGTVDGSTDASADASKDAAYDSTTDAPFDAGCTAGSVSCGGSGGNQVIKCVDGGSSVVATCPSAATCSASLGRCTACSPGAYSCSGATRTQCDAFGAGTTTVATCATPELCAASSGGTCATPACAVGDKSCSGSTALTCNAGRTGFASTVCALGCTGGSCVYVTDLVSSSGGRDTCARLSNGTVRCWGDNSSHQIDAGGSPEIRNPVSLLATSVSQVAVGGDSIAVRSTDGTARWSKIDFTTPVAGVSGAMDIGVGADHMCARLASGAVKCWGNGDFGQLGSGGTATYSPPTLATAVGVTGTGALVLGPSDSFALTASGFLGWGLNDFGQIGSGAPSNRLTPVAAFSGAAQVSAGPDFTCILTASGVVQCVGKNDLGQLGDNSLTNRTTLAAVSSLGAATQISCGTGFACALLTTKTVACWGRNDVGELGNMSTTNSKVPVVVKGLSSVMSIAASDSSACALLADGVTVKCWGNPTRVGAGAPGPADTTVPVTVVW